MTRGVLQLPAAVRITTYRSFSTTSRRFKDPRLSDLGKIIDDEYAFIRDRYATPRHPIVLAHGLFGFDELKLVGQNLPGIEYWRGIREALSRKDVEVITCTVPSSGSIEARAAKLAEDIAFKAGGKSVNIVGHSMGGLDARYMISRLQPPNVDVKSLTTISSPHRGSAFADYMFKRIGPIYVPKLYKALDSFGLDTGAFAQLTRKYMNEEFNPKTPDVKGIKYYSYGANLEPTKWSIFKYSHDVIKALEDSENDGLVSVRSARWGTYQGTITGVSHLDLINWTNRLKWMFLRLTGTMKFNAVAFYLDIADMLAKEGL